ncbi:MAG TPA: hypothetical protein DDW27_08500 [Bacteroidales bacterium]|nr:hypothetical protein [Bacteroidales bacterium]
MIAYENHWLARDRQYLNEMSEQTHDDFIPKWWTLEWEMIEMLDKDVDERSEYWLVRTEWNGMTYEGTGVYVHDELAEVEDIEIKK